MSARGGCHKPPSRIDQVRHDVAAGGALACRLRENKSPSRVDFFWGETRCFDFAACGHDRHSTCALALVFAMAQAQTGYPDRPSNHRADRAGGSYDLVGRHLADVLSKRTGQAFLCRDKPAAGTVVGTQAAAQSEPDGYTAAGRRALQYGLQFGRCIRSSPMIR